MAKPGLAQDQTVEEILASIRQVINGDQSRSASAPPRPLTGVMPAPGGPAVAAVPPSAGNVTAIHGAKIATSEDEASEDWAPEVAAASVDADAVPAAPPVDRSRMHDVVELAIEQALDGVDPDDTRAETAIRATAEVRPPLQTAVGVQAAPQAPDEAPRVAEPRPLREAPRVASPQPNHEVQRVAEPQAARAAPRAVEPRPGPPAASRSLLSPRANAAVAASFGDLAKVLADRNAREIDQVVEDLLRPMLKSWLEDNLPSLVERLVREEIERVSRGGR